MSTIKSIKIVIDENKFKDFIKEINLHNLYKIHEIILYNSSINEQLKISNTNIIKIDKDLKYLSNLNNDYNNRFIICLEHFLESQTKNPYYNQRMEIDFKGNIKNSLKNQLVFGNFYSDDVLEISKSMVFRNLWNASHDKILGIKDSEMRYHMFITHDLIDLGNTEFKIIE